MLVGAGATIHNRGSAGVANPNVYLGQWDRTTGEDTRQGLGDARAQQPGECCNFTSTYHVNFGNISYDRTKFTCSFWMRADNDTTAFMPLISKFKSTGDQREFRISTGAASSGLLRLLAYTGGGASGDRAKAWTSSLKIINGSDFDLWFHVVVSYDGSAATDDQFRIYVNGVEDLDIDRGDDNDDCPSIFDGNGAWELGAADGAGTTFDGKMWNVQWFDETLSHADILKLYLHDDFSVNTVRRFWWKLEETAGTTVYDSSGGFYSGTKSDPSMNLTTGNVPGSFKNRVGYTNDGGVMIGRNELDTTLDSDENALEYSGVCPRNATTGATWDFTGGVSNLDWVYNSPFTVPTAWNPADLDSLPNEMVYTDDTITALDTLFTPLLNVIGPHPGMSATSGPFWPWLVDVRSESDIPFDYMLFVGTDHSAGAGGIYLYTCIGDPRLNSNWVEYDAGLAAGDFAYLGSPPASNPIYVDSVAGTQTETPHIHKIGDTWFMTYHNNGAGTNQSTVLATSTNLVNWTRSGVIIDYTPGDAPGDGHTGYFAWGPDVYGISSGTYAYVGNSLHGGQSRGYGCWWGSNDGYTWTKLDDPLLEVCRGRAATTRPENTNGDSKLQYRFEASGMERVGTQLIYPVSLANNEPNDADKRSDFMIAARDLTGRVNAGLPVIAFARGPVGSESEKQIQNMWPFSYGGALNAVLSTVDISDDNVISFAVKRNLTNRLTDGHPLRDIYPTLPSYTETEFDFLNDGLHADWDFNATTGNASISSNNGAEIEITANATRAFYTWGTGFIPDNYSIIEMWIDSLFYASSNKNGQMSIGWFDDQNGVGAGSDNSHDLTTAFSLGGDCRLRERISAVGASTDLEYIYFGHNNTEAGAPRQIGLRWLVDEAKLFIIGHNREETYEYDVDPTFDTSLTYYAGFGFKADATATIQLTAEKITMRLG